MRDSPYLVLGPVFALALCNIFPLATMHFQAEGTSIVVVIPSCVIHQSHTVFLTNARGLYECTRKFLFSPTICDMKIISNHPGRDGLSPLFLILDLGQPTQKRDGWL